MRVFVSVLLVLCLQKSLVALSFLTVALHGFTPQEASWHTTTHRPQKWIVKNVPYHHPQRSTSPLQLGSSNNNNNNNRKDDDDDDDDNTLVLIRLANQLTESVTRPTAVAGLPTGVVLALLALPLVTSSLIQTILTFLLFIALDVLGRRVVNEPQGTRALSDNDDDDANEINTAWIDVFALVFAASTAYLMLPPSLTTTMLALPDNTTSNNMADSVVVGLGLLAVTVLVLSTQTTAATATAENDNVNDDDDDEDNDYTLTQGKVNGVNRELLDLWDQELRMREKKDNTLPFDEDRRE